MNQALSSRQRVEAALAAAGIAIDVRTFPAGTRTAADAAAAIGCAVAEIAKSIVLRAPESDRVVVVVTSGSNRVDEARVAALLGEPVARADADFVRRKTGFAIGGVAPVGHLEPPAVLIDRDLLGYDQVWAAAGSGDSVFCLTPTELLALTGAPVADVKLEQ
ncbi:YbaK/EbsC family protein [Chitinimonas koreensis]|uniref:YbaK/EbsC family protein n=1 Tax=Chitinimonas koreensis TaxID=356302 RepID=UPI000417353B|nr:YbaK/EbsC family protein [Chitinimonas koreensis]QNM98034.1 YbaK/EbsC family protein [Chitinimonas koreensis]